MSLAEAVVRWYAVLAAVTWALAPAVVWLCVRLEDRGVSVARPLSMLAAVYPAWILASTGVAPFGVELVAVTFLLIGVAGWTLLIRASWGTEPPMRLVRRLALVEIASASLFGAYVWLRGYTPQILGTEKPMDIAFLASSARAVVMPPPDPWFAGEPINYYYLGYLLHGTIARLAGIPTEIAFNLALATIFSTTAVAAFGVAWNVARPRLGAKPAAIAGLFGGFFITVAGNLYTPWRLLQDVSGTISAWWWDGASGIGWRSSRIVCDGPRIDNACPFPATETINEFPYFSFLLGDLHPHVMALPYTVAAIALVWNLWQGLATASDLFVRGWWARVAVTGAIIGALYPLNAWDLPTYLALALAAIWLACGRQMRVAWKPAGLLIATALIAWLPFLTTYKPPASETATTMPEIVDRLPIVSSLFLTVALHLGERTGLAEYLTIFGVPYAFGVALVAAGAVRDSADYREYGLRLSLIAAVATITLGVFLSAPLIPICGIPLALAVAQLKRLPPVSPRAFALLLFAFAWALSIGVEIVYVRDVFADRMNTLFKFYYQVWTLFAIGAAIAIVVLWVGSAARTWQRPVLAAAAVVSVIAGIAYPVVASYQWTDRFAVWRGLDGLAFAETFDPDEVAAVRWLAQNAQPGDVVLEAAGCSYLPFDRLPFNRVSAFSGVPTVIGWANHERQWRAGQPDQIAEIGVRQSAVASMYADPNSPLFGEYEVDWLFVGIYESGNWSAECETAGPYSGIDSGDYPGPAWQEAFAAGDSRVYRRSG